MYESDEWYVQNDLQDKHQNMRLNGKNGHNQTLAQTEDHFDLDASASDNESYEMETKTQL